MPEKKSRIDHMRRILAEIARGREQKIILLEVANGFPPVSSNEPIGPGSSVNAERDPLRLVMAAAFAYLAKLPMYVFHCEAGVFGKTRFQETSGIDRCGAILRLLPPDVANWERNDGKEPNAPFTAFAAGEPNRYLPEARSADDGCVRNISSRKGKRLEESPASRSRSKIGVQLAARRPSGWHSSCLAAWV